MGGSGSGRGVASRHYTTDVCYRLGLAALRAHGGLVPGRQTGGSWAWSEHGETVASIGWELDLQAGVPPRLTLYYGVGTGRWRPDAGPREAHSFDVVATTPHYGGVRRWIVCPCSRRVAFLYLVPGGRLFRCRTCHGLAYRCQRETHEARVFRRSDKLWRRVGRGTSPLPVALRPGRGRRPKGMHRRTYWRIVETADAIDRWAFARFMPRRLLSTLVGASMVGAMRELEPPHEFGTERRHARHR